jgi:hypothetical protein
MLAEFGSEFLVKLADYLPRSNGNMKLSRCDAEDPLEVLPPQRATVSGSPDQQEMNQH